MNEREKVIQALEIHLKPNSRCVGCPYPNNGLCGDQLYRDALALLKAQEARVMTLEELKAYLLIGEDGRFMEGYGWEELAQRVPIYIEPRNPTLGTLYWWTAERLRPWVSESYFQESYGKKRRAWTSRPTDEQREAVKWDERIRQD